MSSDVLWRPIDVRPFGIVYAGAHKNLGPSGLTVVVIRDDVLARCRKGLPTLLTYQTHVDHNSMFNTPVTFTIYMVRNTLRWIKQQGGAPEMERRARARAELFYKFLDASGGFYRNPVPVEDRSVMNAVFYLPTKELEAKLVAEAKAAGILGLRNFHPEGGGRLTMYNALPIESVKAVVEFMGEFQRKNG
jgi:phosphoserine aminotransferase